MTPITTTKILVPQNPMAHPPKLDHAVINVHYQMDLSESIFRKLGFHLTARGYHSLGSINHLMMFGSDYLELIGLPAETIGEKPTRPEVLDAPVGINGLVFKTSDVDETYTHLQALGMAGDPPKSFFRPVDLPDGPQNAHFRTVTVRADIFPGGRIYFCEHGTPELVWRPEWQHHRNGALRMPEFVIASECHDREAADLARLIHSQVEGSGDNLSVKLEDATITLLSPTAYQTRFGDLASCMASRASIFGALTIQTTDLASLRSLAQDSGLPLVDGPRRLTLREPSLDCVLEFVG